MASEAAIGNLPIWASSIALGVHVLSLAAGVIWWLADDDHNTAKRLFTKGSLSLAVGLLLFSALLIIVAYACDHLGKPEYAMLALRLLLFDPLLTALALVCAAVMITPMDKSVPEGRNP